MVAFLTLNASMAASADTRCTSSSPHRREAEVAGRARGGRGCAAMYTPGWVPSAMSRRSALWGGLAAAGALAAGCSNTPVAGPAPPPTGDALPVTDADARPHRCPRRPARRGSWSSGTAAPPGTGPSTRSRPTSSRSGWAPTPSTSTSSPPATGRSSRATSPRSAGPPTSPSAPSSPRAAPPRRSTAPPTPAGSPPTSRSPRCARSARRSASRRRARTTRSTTAGSRW